MRGVRERDAKAASIRGVGNRPVARFLWRAVEAVLRQFDNDERELVVRARLWKGRWLGYRSASFHGSTPDGDLILGEWQYTNPTSRIFNHTVTCSVWRGPFGPGCDCGRQV